MFNIFTFRSKKTAPASKFATMYPRAFRAWQKAAARGQTGLGFEAWRVAQIDKMIKSWELPQATTSHSAKVKAA